MQKENVIDLLVYRDQQETAEDTDAHPSISDELQQAIQNLIYRLRVLGPLPQS